jgi:hypothetical protein
MSLWPSIFRAALPRDWRWLVPPYRDCQCPFCGAINQHRWWSEGKLVRCRWCHRWYILPILIHDREIVDGIGEVVEVIGKATEEGVRVAFRGLQVAAVALVVASLSFLLCCGFFSLVIGSGQSKVAGRPGPVGQTASVDLPPARVKSPARVWEDTSDEEKPRWAPVPTRAPTQISDSAESPPAEEQRAAPENRREHDRLAKEYEEREQRAAKLAHLGRAIEESARLEESHRQDQIEADHQLVLAFLKRSARNYRELYEPVWSGPLAAVGDGREPKEGKLYCMRAKMQSLDAHFRFQTIQVYYFVFLVDGQAAGWQQSGQGFRSVKICRITDPVPDE